MCTYQCPQSLSERLQHSMLLYAPQMQLTEWKGCPLLSEASCCYLLVCCEREVASYPPPRFGQKHHQVTSGVRAWIHSDCAHSTFSLKEEGVCSGLCPSYRSFLGSHNPSAQQCNTQDFYQGSAEQGRP